MKFLKIWTSFNDLIGQLEYDEIGRLFEAMLAYADSGEEPENFDGNERFLWPVAKQQIDLTAERNEVLRQNGMKGGRPITKDNQRKPNVTKGNQTKPVKEYKEKEYKEKECKEKEFIDDDNAREIQTEQDKVLTAAEDAGFKMSNDVRASLITLYADYGVDKILEALKSCVEHGATNLAYLKAVLKGTGKKPDDRSYAGAENEAQDRLLRMSGIDPKTGKKMDAKDIHGYQQRDYSNAQDEAMRRMMEDTWGDEKGAS